MKKQIRANVFETNSSSTHSVTYNRNSNESNLSLSCRDFNDYIKFDEYFKEDRIQVPFGKFGWEINTYDEVWDKLKYVATMLLETYENRLNRDNRGKNPDEVVASFDIYDIYETDDFKDLDDVIYLATGYDWHICFNKDDLVTYEKYNDGTGWFTHGYNCYIDHQSQEDYYCLQDWLNDWGIPSIEVAIFNPAVTINTDNDNY